MNHAVWEKTFQKEGYKQGYCSAAHHDRMPFFRPHSHSTRDKREGSPCFLKKVIGSHLFHCSNKKSSHWKQFLSVCCKYHLSLLSGIKKISGGQLYKTWHLFPNLWRNAYFPRQNILWDAKINMTLPHCLARPLHFEACKQKHKENKSSGSIISFVRRLYLWVISLQATWGRHHLIIHRYYYRLLVKH